MALNIPMPGQPGDSLLKGINTGSELFSRLMQPVLNRENQTLQRDIHRDQNEITKARNEQLAKQFQLDLALRQQAEQRMGANTGLQRQLLQQKIAEHELRTNPKKLMEFIQGIRQQTHQGMPSSGNANQMGSQEEMRLMSDNGMPSVEEMQNPSPVQQMPQQSTGGGLFGNLSPDEQMMLQMAGIKIPVQRENPEQKRFAELQNKLTLEKYKTEQRKALEQEKLNLKNQATRDKTIQSANNDLPHLEQTLSALESMKKIAENNPDLFGHSGFYGIGAEGAADRFAKTTNNPNAGAWQTLGLGPIVAAETKMSAKGNQLALKQALANKPNFSEKQPVALAKINENIRQIKNSIQETRNIAGKTENESGEVRELGGKKYKKINGAWHELR